MNRVLYKRLRNVAARRATITYQEVGDLIGLDMANPAHRNEIAAILGEISSYEHQHGRPLLSAVVVLAETGWPGQGFFDLARACGRMRAGEDNVSFFARELKAVYEACPRPRGERK